MNYHDRSKKIGSRIKAERKNKKLSRQAFMEKMLLSPSSVKTLDAWESGARLPDVQDFVRMAEIFSCDIGYLLCDYDERTRDSSDLCKLTGLSEHSADLLRNLSSICYNGKLVDREKGVNRAYALETTLDLLLQYPHILDVLYQFSRYNAYAHYCDTLRQHETDALRKMDVSVSNKLYDAKLHCADAKNSLQEFLYSILHYLEDGADQKWRNFKYENER